MLCPVCNSVRESNAEYVEPCQRCAKMAKVIDVKWLQDVIAVAIHDALADTFFHSMPVNNHKG